MWYRRERMGFAGFALLTGLERRVVLSALTRALSLLWSEDRFRRGYARNLAGVSIRAQK